MNNETNSKKTIGDFHTQDASQKIITVTADQDKANLFSNFFATVFTDEPLHNIPEPTYKMPENSLSNIHFNVESILKQLDKLNINKSFGPDNMHPRILKELSPVISDTFKVIFENSLDTGILPSDWKTRNISVIHKKGPKHSVENYRPISLTCIDAKLWKV